MNFLLYATFSSSRTRLKATRADYRLVLYLKAFAVSFEKESMLLVVLIIVAIQAEAKLDSRRLHSLKSSKSFCQ